MRAGIVAERGHVLGLTPAQTRLWKPVRAVRRALLDGGLPDDPEAVAAAFRERHGRAVRDADVEAILSASARLVPLEPWHRPARDGWGAATP